MGGGENVFSQDVLYCLFYCMQVILRIKVLGYKPFSLQEKVLFVSKNQFVILYIDCPFNSDNRVAGLKQDAVGSSPLAKFYKQNHCSCFVLME